jgi:hypothetical protein
VILAKYLAELSLADGKSNAGPTEHAVPAILVVREPRQQFGGLRRTEQDKPGPIGTPAFVLTGHPIATRPQLTERKHLSTAGKPHWNLLVKLNAQKTSLRKNTYFERTLSRIPRLQPIKQLQSGKGNGLYLGERGFK